MANSNSTPTGVSPTGDPKTPGKDEKTNDSAKKRVASVDSVRSPVTAALENKSSGDPNFQERLVRNDPIRIEQLENMGYELVKNEKGDRDVVRDLVRMRIPTEKYEERMEAKHARTREMTAMPGSRFQTTARSSGVRAENRTTTKRAPASAVANED